MATQPHKATHFYTPETINETTEMHVMLLSKAKAVGELGPFHDN